MPKKILIVDDDPHIREIVQFALEKVGMKSQSAKDGVEALKVFQAFSPDLIILDISMPEMDGLTFCKEIRKNSDVPVLFLSSMDEEIDRVVGFEIGGNDYVTKPFSPRELVARVKAILKRTNGANKANSENKDEIICGHILITPESHEIFYKDNRLECTSTEFTILQIILSKPARVFAREDLISLAYNNINISDRTVDSHIRNIRKKFTGLGCESVIETIHGIGLKAGTCE